MRPSLSSTLAGSATAVLLTFGQAYGQQQDITVQEAEAYFQKIRQEATEIMRSRDFARVGEWVETNIADGAILQASLSIKSDGMPKGFVEVSLDKDDMRRLVTIFAGGVGEQLISDYGLEVAVAKVVPHGADAATVTVKWTERLSIGADRDENENEQSAQRSQEASVETVADCTHLLRRSESGALALGLSTCRGEVRL